jgi:hypothetical protein
MGVSATLERYEDMVSLVDEIGFLPLFRHPIPGFSVADLTPAANWFDGEAHDPWEWREWAAQSGALAYGKFFRNKTGFISKRFLPLFANARRDGYDFDALYDDGKAPRAHKRLMDLFLAPSPAVIPSHELKARAGFSQKGGGSLDSALTQLQMQTYLRVYKKAQPPRQALRLGGRAIHHARTPLWRGACPKRLRRGARRLL